ncbi:hypothetical protein [Clostridium paraputrificum]|uniref:YfjL-like protein n=1 Tax=Clostridium paraputrificum TaxID=29363 RepID=UPI00232FDD68|nr:hypothetical protein [Clostridium paraputrificum]MDB2108084.1 hypothetical protein [Clostridium paraputrificum]MDB2114943.1 hypothetical protein [Clostridium paraputrificum]
MKVKFNLKKIIYFVILVGILALLFSIYNAFNSNPVSKRIAKNKLNKYIEENYSERDFIIKDVRYNFKFSEYYGRVISQEEGLDYNITLSKNGDIIDLYKENGFIEDVELINSFNKKVEEDFKEGLKDKVSFNKDGNKNDYLFAYFNIIQGKYKDRDIQYSKELDDKFLIQLNLYDEMDGDYRDRFVDLASEIIKYAESNGYKGLSEISISTYINDVEYSILVKRDEFSKDMEELYNNIVKGGYEVNRNSKGEVHFKYIEKEEKK